MNVNRYRGLGSNAEQWETICSHPHYKHDCKLCQIGAWVKEIQVSVSSPKQVDFFKVQGNRVNE